MKHHKLLFVKMYALIHKNKIVSVEPQQNKVALAHKYAKILMQVSVIVYHSVIKTL